MPELPLVGHPYVPLILRHGGSFSFEPLGWYLGSRVIHPKSGPSPITVRSLALTMHEPNKPGVHFHSFEQGQVIDPLLALMTEGQITGHVLKLTASGRGRTLRISIEHPAPGTP